MLCVKCQKRPAVVFVQRLENGKTVQEGYCLTCARAMHIQPLDDLMKQFIMGASMPESEASCKKLDIRSSMFSRSWSDMPNCFIRSSTGWMCMARAQVRQ